MANVATVCLTKIGRKLICPLISPFKRAFNPSGIGIRYSSSTNEMDELEYIRVADETLESLTDKFESFAEFDDCAPSYDVNYSQGVLTVKLGSSDAGTYVINRQTPNLQIWLSSPFSGPKRYDFVQNKWIYQRNQESLHSLLSRELSNFFEKSADKVDFMNCAHAK